MTSQLDRRSAAALVAGALLTAVALGFSFLRPVIAASEQERTAEAIVTHTPESWPPSGGDLDVALASSAVEQISRSGFYDGGVDAGPGDAGPPLRLPPENQRGGLLARVGGHGDIYYLEVVLGGAAFEDPLPLVFLFHGRGGRAELPGGPFRGLAHPLRVIVPQAPEALGDGWEWLPVSVGSGLVDRLSSTLFETSERLAEMIRTLSSTRPTIGKPIVAGFSQGGMLTYALALHHDDVVGHAFPLSTWLPPPIEPLFRRQDLNYPPIRSMHGDADTVIPVGPTRGLVERLASRGFDVEFREFQGVGHEMSPAMNRVFHAWLEQALCDVMGDLECPGAVVPGEAEARADDAGTAAGEASDGGQDGGSAAPDAGARRRARRRPRGPE